MHAETVRTFKVKPHYLLPLLCVASIGNAINPLFSLSSSFINSGSGTSSSTSYTAYSSLGQLASGSFSSVSYQVQTNVLSIADTDSDGILNNVDNCPSVSNINQLNTDADLQGNACDADDDNDGLSDITEASLGTDPLLVDTDGDGLDDGADPNPLTANANGDLAPYGAPDGILNTADILIATRIVAGIITPTTMDLIHADIYPVGAPDGVIDVSDLLLLIKIVLTPAP